MAIFGVWSRFGFRENPYSEATLTPDETGHRLLVGRDSEVENIQIRLGSGGTHPSVEGPIGAGKTSLLNVAAYRMARHCLDLREKELYLPAKERFQPHADADAFELKVMQVVAQTLVEWQDSFEAVGLARPNMHPLDQWLNEPEYGGWQAGGGAATVSASYGRTTEPNTSEGFQKSGFGDAVRAALEEAFPPGTGGIICIMDNLEILETTGSARKTLDELRDRVFNIPQLRWVLCGSRGIVSRARSERLSGIFQAPMIVRKLPDDDAVAAIRTRIEFYGDDDAVAPVTPKAFDFLYRALNSNMREALSHAQEFSHWLASEYPQGQSFPDDSARDELLQIWLAERATDAFRDATSVQPRHWQFFTEVCEAGGRIGSAEFDRFGFGFQQQMTAAVTALVAANLMVREIDPDDGNRTVNSVASLGWLVFFYKSGFDMPPARS
ncbi:ATP-binding protein [Nocardioides terrigena]|uniref:ATP-binding protein n=1 Tax=Nocardioides terrigena TaxID=424797 RepID=UPI000D3083AB|nr:ATP-binding protein [Nocardioides terrigena]